MLLNSMYIFIPHKKEKPSDGQLRRGRPRLPAAFQRKPIVFIPTQIYKKNTEDFTAVGGTNKP